MNQSVGPYTVTKNESKDKARAAGERFNAKVKALTAKPRAELQIPPEVIAKVTSGNPMLAAQIESGAQLSWDTAFEIGKLMWPDLYAQIEAGSAAAVASYAQPTSTTANAASQAASAKLLALVQEAQVSRGLTYDQAFSAVHAEHPELTSQLRDPARR